MATLGNPKSEASPFELRDEADIDTAVKVLYCGLWTYCCNLYGVGIGEAASEFIENYCSTEISQASQDVKALEDASMLKLLKSFVKAYLADEGLMLGYQRQMESATIQLIRTSCYEGHLEPEYIS
ncbi:hypothetical protein FALBO_10990 [Fusarium albosuccineum]|uniref:Uncharacterized protein n=1 Tax=Fusarium albosuccineum TaxID=1237068 RepID=A0A8H4L3E4_9HYPO|nr:hypothetical protein FALBO_10990 [Fusarium albosuccineum]